MNYRLFFSLSILVLILISACDRLAEHSHGTDAADLPGESGHPHPDEIWLTPGQAKAAGVKTDTVRPGDFHGVVVTGGKVMPVSGGETTVVATVAGVVSFARPMAEGMAVGRGSTVCTIASADLQDGDVARRAAIAYETARAEYERGRKLVADKIISEKDFLALKAAYENAGLAYRAVGGNRGGAGVAVRAAQGGYIKERLAKDGDYVAVGQPLLTLTENRRLYLRAEVSGRDFEALGEIRSARFRMAGGDKVYSLEELGGRLVSCGKALEAGTAFVPVIFEFDNRGGILPGGFAEIYLLTGRRQKVISVPVGALTEEQGAFFVYLQEDAEHYRRQEVRLGATDGARTEILSGLKGGERLVTEGAVHVKLASAAATVPGHTHNH